LLIAYLPFVSLFSYFRVERPSDTAFGTPEELERYAAKAGDDVILNWDAQKQCYKSERASVLLGIPQAMPALALADKVLDKTETLGLIDAFELPAISMDNEAAHGKLLLAMSRLLVPPASNQSERFVRPLANFRLKFARLSSNQIGMLGLLGLIRKQSEDSILECWTLRLLEVECR
jgi:hypothetical protein